MGSSVIGSSRVGDRTCAIGSNADGCNVIRNRAWSRADCRWISPCWHAVGCRSVRWRSVHWRSWDRCWEVLLLGRQCRVPRWHLRKRLSRMCVLHGRSDWQLRRNAVRGTSAAGTPRAPTATVAVRVVAVTNSPPEVPPERVDCSRLGLGAVHTGEHQGYCDERQMQFHSDFLPDGAKASMYVYMYRVLTHETREGRGLNAAKQRETVA